MHVHVHVHLHQYHFGCIRDNVHYHPDFTSGICLKDLSSSSSQQGKAAVGKGINPKHLRTKQVDSRTQIRYYFAHTATVVGW